ncbi:GntR family transcriptional regulator [Candidatus Aerophobetes bacterium]|nr:GntR family transcriptional regulator [Candidatus Aerophobetes bacterium]
MVKEELNKSLVDRLEEIIYERIVGGELALGQKINVTELKKEFGISATPIRDALNRLAQRGMITVSPRVGYYVRTFTLQDIEDIYELRKILEIGALEKAINNIKNGELEAHRERTLQSSGRIIKGSKGVKFLKEESPHLLIINNCGNKKLQEAYSRIDDYIEMLLSIHPKGKESFDEHLQLLDALKDRDLEKAKRILERHIENVKQTARELIKKYGAEKGERR